jgi:hypothetical protein
VNLVRAIPGRHTKTDPTAERSFGVVFISQRQSTRGAYFLPDRWMCLHLMIGAVSRCCNRNRPGHDNDDRWLLKVYYYSASFIALLVICLIALSFVLEWGRERGWQISSNLTRRQTSVPLMIACGLVLVSILEFVCLFRSFKKIFDGTRAANNLDQDLYPNNDHDQEFVGQETTGDSSSMFSAKKFIITSEDDDEDEDQDNELAHASRGEEEEGAPANARSAAVRRDRRPVVAAGATAPDSGGSSPHPDIVPGSK